MRDSIYVLLAIIANLWLINHALPQPELDRLPEMKPEPIFVLPYDEAYKKACSEALPLVIFLNTPAREVPGCVVTNVNKWEAISFNVGVIIGAPTCWELGFKGKVEQRVVAECYGPRSPGHIKALINEYKKKLDAQLEARDQNIVNFADCHPDG